MNDTYTIIELLKSIDKRLAAIEQKLYILDEINENVRKLRFNK